MNPLISSAGRPVDDRGLVRRVGLDAVLSRALGGGPVVTRLGPYALSRKVGAGGMGVVFRASDERDGRVVAIKLLEHGGPELRGRFAREARILRGLSHPKIVRYLDDGVAPDGSPYLVMEWLDGHDLATHMEAGPLAVADALRIAAGAARGLSAAHAAGVVHRDVKPANLFLVSPDDDVRVIDFGVARAPGAEAGLTATGVLVGTPNYMAPEQLRGEHGPAADVWGLGVTLFEMLTGRLPFPGRDPAAVLLAVMNAPLPSLTALRPDAPPALEWLLGRLLARDPAARPADMAAVVAELADVRADLGAPAAVNPPPAVSMRELAPYAVTLAALPAAASPLVVSSGDAEGVPLGRAGAFGQLSGLLDETLLESVCNLVLVTAESGLGRTHLVEAFAGAVASRVDAASGRVLLGRGDGSGVPYALLEALVRSAGPASPPEAGLLSRLGHVHDAPGSAFAEVHALADALRIAWFEVAQHWSARGPVLLVVDDAHRADLASLRALSRAAASWAQQRVMVVVTAPTGASRAEISGVFGGAMTVVELDRLRPLPMRQLAARLLGATASPTVSDADALDRCVREAAGHPGHLRVLCANRGAAAGEHDAVGLVWSHLESLEPEARRVLRAASLIGDPFEAELVTVLVGGPPEVVAQHLERLVARGFLRRPGGGAGHGAATFAFEGELVRVACHRLSTEDDVAAAHARLASALVARGGATPERIAAHHAAAGCPAQAAPYTLKAAHAALAGGDDAALARLVALGRAQAETDAQRAEFELLAAEGAFWEGRVADAAVLAGSAAARSAPGSVGWWRSQAWVVTAAGQAGDNGALLAVADTLPGDESPTTPHARDARCIVMSRLVTQLSGVAPETFNRLRAEVARERETGGLGPLARAWAWRAAPEVPPRNFDAAISAFTEAHAAHVEALDPRGAAQVQLYLGSFYCWTGAWARAGEVIDDALRTARMLGADYLVTWAEYTRGKLLTETAPYETTRTSLSAVIEGSAQSPRIRAGARLYLSLAALRAGDRDTAADQARAVLDDRAASALHSSAAAALVRARLADGDAAGALAHRDVLAAALSRETVEFDALIRLAFAELEAARGDAAEAALARHSARATLEARALGLASPLRRSEFLHLPHLNAATMALAPEG
ncbi:protein kinase [Myxococcota bacterium]|nr:protein kinase [Myxococcota bacterium]